MVKISKLFAYHVKENKEVYRENLRIQSECGKILTRNTPNIDTFHVVGGSIFPKET